MKVLMVSQTDIKGGASKATYRLHESLLKQNIESQILVQNKYSDSFTVISNKSYKILLKNALRSFLNPIPNKMYKNKAKTLFSSEWFGFSDIVEHINKINPDIVHLHWICGNMMRVEDIAKIKAPIIWSLHDNWPFTGGCHVMWECERYKDECGNCPQLVSNKDNDLSRKNFIRKQKTFSKINNMTIVGVSKWITSCSQESALLKNKKHITLPNPLNTELFKHIDKKNTRELWNLPQDKKLILFGATNATSDINKGFKLLEEALIKLKGDDFEFVVFGSSKPEKPTILNYPTNYVGQLKDDVSLVSLYSAVDVMVVPSLQESFGQTASEAMACGIPVVTFAHTGLLDIVDHKVNGYLAKPFETDDLAFGIEWILNNPENIDLSKNAINKVRSTFSYDVVAKQYIELYKDILK